MPPKRGPFNNREGRSQYTDLDPCVQIKPAEILNIDELPRTYQPPFTPYFRKVQGKDSDNLFENSGRKPYGNLGEKLQVVVNMLQLDLTKSQPRCLYRVDFNPEVEMQKRRNYLIHMAFEDKAEKHAYDGDHFVYTNALVRGGKEFTFEGELMISRETGEKQPVVLNFKFTGHQNSTLDQDTLMFYCSRLRCGVSKIDDRVAIGKNYYDLSQAETLQDYNCQLVPGLDSTIHITEAGPVLNVDFTSRNIRTDTVWDLIKIDRRNRETDVTIASKYNNRSVLLKYGKKRAVYISEVMFDMKSTIDTFIDKSGQPITYADYIKKQYGIQSVDLNEPQPMLKHVSETEKDGEKKEKISYFIPSLCHMTGLTDEMREDRRFGQAMIRKTAVPPAERLKKISLSLDSMTNNEHFRREVHPWNLFIPKAFMEVPARRLPNPELRNLEGPIQVNQSARWNIQGRWPMFRSSKFQNWALVVPPNFSNDFVATLIEVSQRLNITLQPPTPYCTTGIRPIDYKNTLERDVARDRPTFVLMIVRKTDENIYKSSKILLAKVGVRSQFVSESTINKGPHMIAAKLLVQMNSKAGGAPWAVNLKMGKPTMFVGIDIHHSHNKGGSIGAYVASVDNNITYFYSRTYPIKPKQQIHHSSVEPDLLRGLTIDAIKEFKEFNKVFPKLIVVYRDGGSTGELKDIETVEATQFQRAIDELKIDCRLVFVVVSKKIRTRFFELDRPNGRGVANPPPGTIVDRCIVSNILPEFYLCCQSVNLGSATPTKYTKIYDTDNIDPNTLHMYTYGLAHTYFNWEGTIRTPSVIKYASSLAKFAGQILGGEKIHPNLFKSLHYL